MRRSGKSAWFLGFPRFFPFCLFLQSASAQIRYSIPEELTRGAFVGNIAKDLGTDVAKLAAANLQVLSDSDSQYFSVNVNTGVIVVNDRIDREHLCEQNYRCSLHLKLAIENPVELYRIEVEILDINDNPPAFPSSEVALQIYELASLGARFPIQPAQDPDVGSNALQTYHLSANENFSLNVKARTDGGKFPELVLEKALDREHRAVHYLVLTAEDGGSPPKSSKARIAIQVLDANDNHPVFDRPSYRVRLVENAPLGTLVARLNATDVDEGPNGAVRYSLSSHNSEALREVFAIEDQTGEIRVRGRVDFEVAALYEIEVEARDMGSPPMEEHCSVVVEVTDVNDNAPEVAVTSFSSSLSEDAPPGTVVAVLHVRDRDSGEHGRVQCQVPSDLPFLLRKDFEHQYSLLTSAPLDRETIPQYNVTIFAADLGDPPLSRHIVLAVALSDVNDNPPRFGRASYEVMVAENNPAGRVLLTVSAVDLDQDQNSRLSYSIVSGPDTGPAADPSRYVAIHPSNGQISSLLSFDYEQTPYFQVQVEVSDGGSPPLSNRAVVHVFVTDQNDNAPGVRFPAAGRDATVQLKIPRSVPPGALIAKIGAVDLDSGLNAWLSYHLEQATDAGLFSLALRSGEIRTARALEEQDAEAQELLVVIKDAGEPPMSTAVTVLVLLEEGVPEAFRGLRAHTAESENIPGITLYLIASLAIVSAISLAGLVGLGVRCLRRETRAESSGLGCCAQGDTLGPPPNHLLGHLQYQPGAADTMIGVQVTPTAPPARGYRSCFSPVSDISEFMFMKPSGNTSGSNAPDPCYSSEQAQPNTDWRFSQAQRPGTSGSQNGEEGGAWPNNQFDTEMLQAMIMASANEAADGNSTLGGGTGTMGLSARYGPQFTLQHVPDYRQNVYIPGSTATLSNSSGKRDAKSSGSSGGNKKKSGKKEKK
ncbi:PREDICTED: protocadherin gamma-C5-like [Gavialis gangeticus]|uniref:protocadherin gamma-C5-like n=1 Tax=Gavialis gangeticus TaxID=94835 RepID=UPI00092EC975|nr:PREDICTED: protocadherin gamma-C5-like [Gavialis gangeticus]